MSTNLAQSLNDSIDRHNAGQRTNARESHTLESLAARLLVSPETAQRLIAKGIVQSEGPVHRGDDGLQSYLSDDLNEVRRAVLSTVVEGVIDQAGSADEISIASSHALKKHVEEFGAQPKNVTEFARDSAGRYYEDEPGTIRQAAGIAGTAGAAYGVGSYLRGRAPGLSPFAAIRAGHIKNIATAGKVGAFVRPGAAAAARTGRNIFAAGSAAAKAGAAVLAERMRLRRG